MSNRDNRTDPYQATIFNLCMAANAVADIPTCQTGSDTELTHYMKAALTGGILPQTSLHGVFHDYDGPPLPGFFATQNKYLAGGDWDLV